MDSHNVFKLSEVITRDILQEKFEEAQKDRRGKEVKFIEFVLISVKRYVLENNETGEKKINKWFSLPNGMRKAVFIEIEDKLKTMFVDSVINITPSNIYDINDENSVMIEIDWSEPHCLTFTEENDSSAVCNKLGQDDEAL